MNPFEIPLGPDGHPIHGMPRYPPRNGSENIIQPTDVRLLPSWPPVGQESLQLEPTSPPVKMEDGAANDASPFSAPEALTGDNTIHNINHLAQQQLDYAADPEPSIPTPFVFGQVNNGLRGFNFQPGRLPSTRDPLHLSSLLNFDNTYIVDGNADIFHGHWRPLQRNNGRLLAPNASAATQTGFTYPFPECQSLSSNSNDDSNSANEIAPAVAPAGFATQQQQHPVLFPRPMFVFSANNSTTTTTTNTPTRVLAVRPLRRRPLEASAAAAGAIPPTSNNTYYYQNYHNNNNYLPDGIREEARYHLTAAGTSHRELYLASTETEPLPIPSPAGNAVDMRVLLDALQLYPCLGLDGMSYCDSRDEDDDDAEAG
ncbi:hypothetical protein NQ176_g7854 [Zarea fungicola]|uniref:Uncharacterized protein n=1 Tax=Zarea fungicola TaxID=93591 RepID=A0ACC1MX63_9HYPO|nr:hypothetical protein NQ176_g7854 [Lecanicillium fungicola]